MRKGHLEEANSLATKVAEAIASFNAGRLKNSDFGVDARDVWETVRNITGKRPTAIPPPGVDSQSLNAHYSSTSTDPMYSLPLLKSTCVPLFSWPSKEIVFHLLDNLHTNASVPIGFLFGFLNLLLLLFLPQCLFYTGTLSHHPLYPLNGSFPP